MAYVIAITGPPGAGKTSLARGIAGRLQDAVTVHFDSYETVTRASAKDILEWMNRGADCNEFVIPGLSEDLKKLKRGEPILDPVRKVEMQPGRFVLFETPFGREHAATAESIDLSIWIDVPLDLALARKVKEFTDEFLTQRRDAHTACLGWLQAYVSNYLGGIRRTLQVQHERIGGKADIVIDGSADPGDMREQAVREIRSRVP